MPTVAQLRTLREVAEHGLAIRTPGPHQRLDYTWRVAGIPRTSTIHPLISRGYLHVTGSDTATLTALGRAAIREAAQ